MVVTATFTDVLRIAVGGAGGIYDHMGVVVCQCRNFAGLPIVAAGACAGFDAGLQAGGFLCYGPLAQVMAQYRDHCAADNELAAVTKEKVCAVVLGDKIKEAAKELAGYGADIIYVVEDKELKYYLTEQYSQAVYQVLKTYEPNIVLSVSYTHLTLPTKLEV